MKVVRRKKSTASHEGGRGQEVLLNEHEVAGEVEDIAGCLIQVLRQNASRFVEHEGRFVVKGQMWQKS